MRRELIHPTILECAATVDHPYWVNVLTNMAHGICPTGSYISNNALTAATFAWEIPTTDDEESLEESTKELIELFQENLGLFSEEDTAEREEHFYQVLASKGPNSTPETWPEIKKIYGKELPLAYFIGKRFTNSDGIMDIASARRALADVYVGLSVKTIGNDDIVVQDGKIIAIPQVGL